MRIGVIQASSQAQKNGLIYETVKRYAKDAEVVNFGCRVGEDGEWSYIEVSVMIGMLIWSGAVDLVITGCSSGQGMMLACNSMPGVLAGYAPTPMDAYLFAQINDGNVVSLPLGEDYTYGGRENLERTVEKLFSEPFGQGHPKKDAERKLRDTALLKDIRRRSQGDMISVLEGLDEKTFGAVMRKRDVIAYLAENSRDEKLIELITGKEKAK